MTTPMPEVAKRIRPFWGRATVIPSTVDEEQLGSGLIVPLAFDGDHDVKRGVLVDLDPSTTETPLSRASVDQLASGTVVYYRGGIRIYDVVVVEMSEIVAFETAE